jgi:hypothetical protein
MKSSDMPSQDSPSLPLRSRQAAKLPSLALLLLLLLLLSELPAGAHRPGLPGIIETLAG